jgi:hypothetical protein
VAKFIPGVTELLGSSKKNEGKQWHEDEDSFIYRANEIVRSSPKPQSLSEVWNIGKEIRTMLDDHGRVFSASVECFATREGYRIEYMYIPRGAGSYRIDNTIQID